MWDDIEVSPPHAGEVRVRIHATGVCHTDATAILGVVDDFGKPYPQILGHEGAGVVESVGDNVTHVKAGDHVLLHMAQCDKCPLCKSGKTNLCVDWVGQYMKGKMADGTTRFSQNGKAVSHYLGISTFTEYTVLPATGVTKIDPSAPFEKVCLLGCGLTTGYGSAVTHAKVEANSTIAVFGLGAVGLGVIQGALECKASKIFAVDTKPSKFPLATKLGPEGVIEAVNPKDFKSPIEQVLKEKTNGAGVDYVFECAGSTEAAISAMNSCNDLWGHVVIVGMPTKPDTFPVAHLPFVKGKKITGCVYGAVRHTEVAGIVEKYLKNNWLHDDMITYTLKPQDIRKAFEYMHDGTAIRSVIKFV